MKYKKCGKCGDTKSINEYKRITDSWCTICTNKYTDEYSKLHKEEKKEYDKIYHQNNKERDNERSKEWNLNNPDYGKEWRKNNPGCYKEWNKEYNSRRDVKDRRNKKLKEKRETNISFKLNTDMATNMRKSLKGKKNGAHWESLAGYTCSEFRAHIEKQFLPGMTWENHGKGDGKWHIDHIIPVSIFNITSNKCKGFRACWALENLRPMWSSENIRKSNTLFY